VSEHRVSVTIDGGRGTPAVGAGVVARAGHTDTASLDAAPPAGDRATVAAAERAAARLLAGPVRPSQRRRWPVRQFVKRLTSRGRTSSQRPISEIHNFSALGVRTRAVCPPLYTCGWEGSFHVVYVAKSHPGLASGSVRPGDLAGLPFDRTVDGSVGILAVAKVCATHVPLDPGRRPFPQPDVLFAGACTTGTLMGCVRYLQK
jgi:hypothetical protein